MKYLKLLVLLSVLASLVVLQSAFAGEYRVGVVTARVLNVRENPSTKSPVVGQIYKDDEVMMYQESHGKNGDWVFVAYGDLEGWVARKYVKITNVYSY